MSLLKIQDFSAKIKDSVEKYIDTLNSPSTASPADKMDVLKWTNGGHLVLPNEDNLELCSKINAATNPVPQQEELLISDEVKSKLTSEVQGFQDRRAAACNGCKGADGKVLFVSEDARQQLTSQIQQRNGIDPNNPVTPEIKPIPATPDLVNMDALAEGDTPLERLEYRMADFKETSVYDSTASDTQEKINQDMFKASSNPMTPKSRKLISKSASAQMVSRDMSKQMPLVYKYNLMKYSYVEYMDSLGCYQNQAPLSEPVTAGYSEFGNLGSSVGNLYNTSGETAESLYGVSLSTENLSEGLPSSFTDSLSAVRESMLNLESRIQSIKEIDLKEAISQKVKDQMVSMWKACGDVEPGGMSGFPAHEKIQRLQGINTFAKGLVSDYQKSMLENQQSLDAGRLYSSSFESIGKIKFPSQITSLQESMTAISDYQSKLMSYPVETVMDSGMMKSAISKMQSANEAISSAISSIRERTSKYNIAPQLLAVRDQLLDMNSTLNDYRSQFNYSSENGFEISSELKERAYSFAQSHLSSLIQSNSQLSQISELSNKFTTMDPASSLFNASYRPLNNFGSLLMMKRLYNASQDYSELELTRESLGTILQDQAMAAIGDVDGLKAQLDKILPFSTDALYNKMQSLYEMNNELMDKYNTYYQYYDDLNSLGEEYLANAEDLYAQLSNPVDFLQSSTYVSNIMSNLTGMVDNVYELGNNYVSSFLESQPVIGQMLSTATNLASNMSGLFTLNSGTEILEYLSDCATDMLLSNIPEGMTEMVTSPEAFVSNLAYNFVSSNGLDSTLETVFEIENMMANLDSDSLLEMLNGDVISEFLGVDSLASTFSDYSSTAQSLVSSYTDTASSFLNEVTSVAAAVAEAMADDDIDDEDEEFADDEDEDVDSMSSLSAAAGGATLMCGSNSGMLQCVNGISPITYLISPSTEMYQGSSVMGNIIAPTLFPSTGGCTLASNPTSAATLGVPPYTCIAMTHAPFTPGYSTFVLMKGSSPALQMNDMACCLFASGGQIQATVPGQTSTLK
ncbi:hypothetical protein P0136_04425 [Lentisphaerota bacterium ZTH]|nr:hypothetical protein JYG24_04455 [Lentisphaerota bacterium]WET07240.1 hypothetical protein P0136_04425 [Lentisphaerota bacterium ZTH]